MGAATTGRRRHRPVRRPAAATLAVTLLIGAAQLHAATTATAGPGTRYGSAAADDPVTPPGSVATYTPPVIDGDNPGLRMREGATLATSRVLDIVSIVESEGGEERREQTTSSLKFALQAEVLFGKDSHELTPQANSRIAAIAEEIRKNGARQVRVFGFTDNLGTYRYGRVLSRKRADAVHGMLGDQLEDPAVSYIVRGYSEDFPIADNSTEEGRKKNRRVEVSFPTGGER
ncbi:OmpA family protein [Streptomyces yaizuensis]|uniref:OmpA family protein n=1 Tax=Streptomyces yaizuensis TaxID=2989713 RepID=A0ABQ5NVZ0_9ACTN|nr:OmpA family protein [Streptomyces sp. YSPA8]GLF94385.1 OmpA family protein [Streptomyces sp. YSPA8]